MTSQKLAAAKMEIHSTTNYDSFGVVTSNRDINKTHVNKLAASIKKKNLMCYKPALVNEKNAVIDGQHRLEACKLAGESFHYIQGEGLTKEDMAILNSNQRNWTQMDFVNYYAIEGIRPYQELCKLINKYPQLRWSMIVRLCGDNRVMREGGFSGPNLARTKLVCGWMAEISKTFFFCKERAFGFAMDRAVAAQPDFEILLRKANTTNLVKCHSEIEYKALIDKILKQ